MKSSSISGNILSLPHEVIFRIAELISDNHDDWYLQEFSLLSKEIFRLVSPLIYQRQTVQMDNSLIMALTGFFFDPKCSPVSEFYPFDPDRLVRPPFTSQEIGSSILVRTAWKCQWTKHVVVSADNVIQLGGFARRLRRSKIFLFPRLQRLVLQESANKNSRLTSIIETLVPGDQVDHLCLHAKLSEFKRFTPYVRKTLTIHPCRQPMDPDESDGEVDRDRDMGTLKIDVQLNKWFLGVEDFESDLNKEQEAILNHLFWEWYEPEDPDVRTPKLHISALESDPWDGEDWARKATVEISRKERYDFKWEAIKVYVEYDSLSEDGVSCKACFQGLSLDRRNMYGNDHELSPWSNERKRRRAYPGASFPLLHRYIHVRSGMSGPTVSIRIHKMIWTWISPLLASSSQSTLPAELIFKIAQLLHDRALYRTLLKLSLASKETYCIVNPVLHQQHTLYVDSLVVNHLSDSFSDYFPDPYLSSFTKVKRLPRDFWAPLSVASHRRTRTLWLCQFAESVMIKDVDLLRLPDISQKLTTINMAFFPRLQHLAIKTQKKTNFIRKSVLQTILPRGSIEHLCVTHPRKSRLKWDIDGYLPYATNTLNFHSPDYDTENVLRIDVKQNIWYLRIAHQVSFNRISNESITLSYLFRQWAKMKSCNIAQKPHLVLAVGGDAKNGYSGGRVWILHILETFNRKARDDPATEMLSWDDLNSLIELQTVTPHCDFHPCYKQGQLSRRRKLLIRFPDDDSSSSSSY
ncbi:hypothetical protein TREMEDRAFT_65820 [Tremella mesenterica DSM 1558]|uniref:uncharacterized protein n=1 Tax=Tremella mesenterica (strain ATCC 24925 / CBS 8224 / DSM 1558 / NBRC 9311 / NRRL Y-6157 / RJB 2259-6 / UBC 559-6) TaxID=578456 RepID=UPI00032C5C73|nr:uncharacterized protein TREMEDRAFT_65820 [Tremella mesenterica DSM 1558]EIW66212.1 hypothetical protein TREMEDRAFT_65820 [Tremella mesenterica DSM 1558]